jgi:hypothetical protein
LTLVGSSGVPMVSRLPDDGPATVCGTDLAIGRTRFARGVDGHSVPIRWVTGEPMVGSLTIWRSLWNFHPGTGLVPVLIGENTSNPPSFRWEFEDLLLGVDLPVDLPDAEAPLAETWPGAEEPDGAAFLTTPFGREYPGLAPAEDQPLTEGSLDR